MAWLISADAEWLSSLQLSAISPNSQQIVRMICPVYTIDSSFGVFGAEEQVSVFKEKSPLFPTVGMAAPIQKILHLSGVPFNFFGVIPGGILNRHHAGSDGF